MGLDGGDAMVYDKNGNMIMDGAHFIDGIAYNHMNLPESLEKKHEYFKYFYSADGTKLSSIQFLREFGQMIVNDYLDGFQYKDGVLQFIPTSEGYYSFTDNRYVYNYTDHLGNIRLSYTKNGAGAQILEENNYYPFGLNHSGYNSTPGTSSYKYKYNGKELQETGYYDYGARMYMADIGRWGVIDNKAEKYYSYSSYAYAINNPIKYLDPDGNDIIIWYKSSDGKMHSYDYKYGANYTGKNKYLIAFHNSANALIKSGAGKNLKALEARKEMVWVRDDMYDSKIGPAFYPDYMSITWKPTEGLDTDGDSDLTATAILDHEIAHALGFIIDPVGYRKRSVPNGTDYDNNEEKRVITGPEQQTARKLGLTKGKQVTRKNHRGSLYDTAGVNTTKRKSTEIEEVVITVKRKSKANVRGSESNKKRTPL